METKLFGDLDINSYFKLNDCTYLKKSIETARNMATGEIIEVSLYQEVEAGKNPKFILNY